MQKSFLSFMKEQLLILSNLQKSLPAFNSYKSWSDLSMVLNKYTRVLNYVNGYNDEFKRGTTIYFNDITGIREEIQHSLYAESLKEKKLLFEKAKNQLKADIDALASLIKQQEKLVEIYA